MEIVRSDDILDIYISNYSRYMKIHNIGDVSIEDRWEVEAAREYMIRQQDRYDSIINEERRYQRTMANYVRRIMEKFKKSDVLLIEYPI